MTLHRLRSASPVLVAALAALLGACSYCGKKTEDVPPPPPVEAGPAQPAESEAGPCARGEMTECTSLATALLEQGKDEEALAAFLAACDGDHLPACAELGRMYLEGQGTEKDYKKAHEAFARSCPLDAPDRAVAKGCTNLCVSLITGVSGERDEVRARQACQLSCDADQWEGCARLGAIWMQGLEVEADPEKGFELTRKACDGGNELGCMNLGFYLSRGMGTEKDVQKARPLLMDACDKGQKPACTELSKITGEQAAP